MKKEKGVKIIDIQMDKLITDREILSNIYAYLAENTDNSYKAEYYQHKSDRLSNCKKRHWCRVKLCPVCEFYRQLGVSKDLTKIMKDMKNDYDFIFFTLTIKNCKDYQLGKKVDKIMNAWDKLVRYKIIKEAVTGWYRWIEISYNRTEDTYHPHLHIIAAANYIDKEKLQSLWEKAMRLDYEPIVKITKVVDIENMPNYVRKKKDRDYIIPDDIEVSGKAIATLDHILQHRRISGYGGEMKKLHSRSSKKG